MLASCYFWDIKPKGSRIPIQCLQNLDNRIPKRTQREIAAARPFEAGGLKRLVAAKGN